MPVTNLYGWMAPAPPAIHPATSSARWNVFFLKKYKKKEQNLKTPLVMNRGSKQTVPRLLYLYRLCGLIHSMMRRFERQVPLIL